MLDPLYLQQEEHSYKILRICNKEHSWKIPNICNKRGTHVRASISATSGAWEPSGSMVECLTQDRRAVGLSLIGVTALFFEQDTLILA